MCPPTDRLDTAAMPIAQVFGSNSDREAPASPRTPREKSVGRRFTAPAASAGGRSHTARGLDGCYMRRPPNGPPPPSPRPPGRRPASPSWIGGAGSSVRVWRLEILLGHQRPNIPWPGHRREAGSRRSCDLHRDPSGPGSIIGSGTNRAQPAVFRRAVGPDLPSSNSAEYSATGNGRPSHR